VECSVTLRSGMCPGLIHLIGTAGRVGTDHVPLVRANGYQMARSVELEFDPCLVHVHRASRQTGKRHERGSVGLFIKQDVIERGASIGHRSGFLRHAQLTFNISHSGSTRLELADLCLRDFCPLVAPIKIRQHAATAETFKSFMIPPHRDWECFSYPGHKSLNQSEDIYVDRQMDFSPTNISTITSYQRLPPPWQR